jgi:hypothetical protein
MTHPPQQLDKMPADLVRQLIAEFENNQEVKKLPERVFGLDIKRSCELVTPIIDQVLGKDQWELAGGNFFETETGYRVHADTGYEGPERVQQTFVFPLRLSLLPRKQADFDRLRIFILNQSWAGNAAFFMRGDTVDPGEYNQAITDYQDVIGLEEGTMDGILLDNCPHLNVMNFAGLTVDQSFRWIVGRPITFPRNRLHVTTPLNRNGFASKLGLSIFTSPRGQ